jgi:predicted HicB family RNase H-like nuclease
MMDAIMEYKGCVAKVEFDDEAGILHREVLDTRDVIPFQGNSVAEWKTAFQESIDDYLALRLPSFGAVGAPGRL